MGNRLGTFVRQLYVSRVKNMHFWSPSDPCRQGEAEVRILDFKTTWTEFQKASQTATKRGNAELRILDHYGRNEADLIQISLYICQWTLQFLIFLPQMSQKCVFLMLKSIHQTLWIILTIIKRFTRGRFWHRKIKTNIRSNNISAISTPPGYPRAKFC